MASVELHEVRIGAVMFEEAVKCDGVSCRDKLQPNSHHLTRWGVFWWRTWGLHHGRLPKKMARP